MSQAPGTLREQKQVVTELPRRGEMSLRTDCTQEMYLCILLTSASQTSRLEGLVEIGDDVSAGGRGSVKLDNRQR